MLMNLESTRLLASNTFAMTAAAIRLLVLVVQLFLLLDGGVLLRVVLAYERCSEEMGGGFCPTGNTCCPASGPDDSYSSGSLPRYPFDGGSAAASPTTMATASHQHALQQFGDSGGWCIPSDLGSYRAVCCPWDRGSAPPTGCGVGYRCGANQTCVFVGSNESRGGSTPDPLLAVLPRYQLGPQIVTARPPPLFGYPVWGDDHQLAYYSSHGDVTTLSLHQRREIAMVLIVVHGANRNADDYYCGATSTVRLQQRYAPGSVLIVAPFFASVTDPNVELVGGGLAMRWWSEEDDRGDPNGPWRYGADAVSHTNTTSVTGSLSSFRALDLLVSFILASSDDRNDSDSGLWLPHLDRVVVAGHSSGGQFVQRWSLLTPVWEDVEVRGDGAAAASVVLHGVVANPSSYAFLTPLRPPPGGDPGTTEPWVFPPLSNCPDYNQWEWGLDPGGAYSNPYLVRQLHAVGGVPRLIQRFRCRSLTYLAGAQDRCNVSSTVVRDDATPSAAWCDSHGLETTCRDLLQGATRWDRFWNYATMLRRLGFRDLSSLSSPSLQFVVVPGVGHDHSLMFQSDEGLQAIFGSDPAADVVVVASG